MSSGKSRIPPPSEKLFRLAHVRKMRDCEQVAAVCYRVRSGEIEFLLVRTGSGHWTFPKGGVEPGLSHAQAAALEAFEEAGVHGRMEEAPFARYVRHKRGGERGSAAGSAEKGIATSAHLCEVLRLVTPQESNRNPTWFSSEKTKKKLIECRTTEFGAELVRIVDRAVARVRRLLHTTADPNDALQRVQFEASADAGLHAWSEKTFVRPVHRNLGPALPAKMNIDGAHRGKILQLGPTLVVNAARGVKRLSGAASVAEKKRD